MGIRLGMVDWLRQCRLLALFSSSKEAKPQDGKVSFASAQGEKPLSNHLARRLRTEARVNSSVLLLQLGDESQRILVVRFTSRGGPVWMHPASTPRGTRTRSSSLRIEDF